MHSRVFLLLGLAALAFGAEPAWNNAVLGLIQRTAGPEAVNYFRLEEIAATADGKDVFEVEGDFNAHQVIVRGNNGVAAASGFYRYIREFWNASVTWGIDKSGSNIHLPSHHLLPLPSTPLRSSSPVQFRYAWNVCTFDYTAAFWSWREWEAQIDYLALHGYNLPLAFVGQEKIWRQLYLEAGLTEDDLAQYFSGPAFLAWQRMGNLQGWGGPLPLDWIESQSQLQIQILSRMRDFGMKAVLPGFAGHVPRTLSRLFPDAKIIESAAWGRFSSNYTQDGLLEPDDPLFLKLAKRFYEIQQSVYGTDHFYNADTYNEMDPSSTTPSFLAATNRAIYDAMAAADAEAIFVMQGWLFHSDFWKDVSRIEAFLSQVPNDKMIILDLNSEEVPVWNYTSNFFGKQWIWNMLHNYGGVRGVYGDFQIASQSPFAALSQSNGTMIGFGVTPEDASTNPALYELFSEINWRSEPISDLNEWVRTYALRRYGAESESATEAWRELRQSAYTTFENFRSPVAAAPALTMNVNRRTNATGILRAARLLTAAVLDGELSYSNPLTYDVVDVTRQVIADSFYDLTLLLESVFQRYQFRGENSTVSVENVAQEIRNMIRDEDSLLQTDSNTLLGRWIKMAKEQAVTMKKNKKMMTAEEEKLEEDEEKLMEFNARNILTMWGPEENIEDYASKEWNGLVGDYYLRRWDLFLTLLTDSVKSGQEMDFPAYQAKRLALEQEWSNETVVFPATAAGDSVVKASQILEKYFSPAGVENDYEELKGVDAPLHDLLARGPAWNLDVNHLKRLCDLDPVCVGFNSNGYLKYDVTSTKSDNSSLFVKKSKK